MSVQKSQNNNKLSTTLPHRAIEKGQAQLAILAEDCNQPDYKKLIEALCAEHNVSLLSVPENKCLGQWAGLCKIDAEGTARNVVGCSCAVVTDYGEETEGRSVLQEYLKSVSAGFVSESTLHLLILGNKTTMSV